MRGGTVVGNPWTFPFIWVGVFNVGSWILSSDSDVEAHDVDFLEILTESMVAMHRLDFEYLVETSGPVVWPMLIGCIPVAVFVWILFFMPLRPMISRYQAARHHKRTRTRKLRKREKAKS